MPAPVEPTAEFTGNTRFQIVRRIGAGGIGLVYEAIDREYGARVAVKTLQRLDGEALLRFKKEFRMLQGLHHLNLVRLGELFEEGGHWFFSMELLDGVDFMTHVTGRERDSAPMQAATGSITEPETLQFPGRRAGSLDAAPILGDSGASWPQPSTDPSTVVLSPGELSRLKDEAQRVDADAGLVLIGHVFDEARLREALRQLVDGLCALHRAGMVHRDIKPQNVMVCAGRVVLLDFGLVSEERPWHRHHSEEGMVLGTPTYMAPEQAEGHAATPASDWYAVGTMMYQALTGRRPFEGQAMQILREKPQRDPAPPSRRVVDPKVVPHDLEALCMRLLQRDPADRPSGPELLAALSGGVPAELADTSVSMPVLGLDTEVELVGRERELSALRDAFAACAPSHPNLVFVRGSSGMGKTSLVEHFAREVRDRHGALVLRGRCYEREAVPYKAFDGVIDELSRYLHKLRLLVEDDTELFDSDTEARFPERHDGYATGSQATQTGQRHSDLGLGVELDPELADAVHSLISQEFTVLGRLFPVLEGMFEAPTGFDSLVVSEPRSMVAPRPGTPRPEVTRDGGTFPGDIRDPGELRRRAFAALKLLLGRIAVIRPLVVMIDDLQWGDSDSAALLTELVSPPDAPSLLLVASYRSEEAASSFITSLRASARRAVGADALQDIEVGPLSDNDSRALALAIWRRLERRRVGPATAPPRIDAAAGAGPDGDVAEHIARIGIRDCAGSPFFIGEMMRYLAGLSPEESAPAVSGRINLDRVLRERRQQLEPSARRLLDVVAVAGRPLPQGVAMRAAGLAGTEMAALAALRAGHFVRTRGPGLADAVETYHDRIREAVVAELGPEELRGHHGWLGEALEDWGSDDAEMLAEHYLGAGRPDRAARHALQAAENAERALAFDRAARMLRLVLDARSWSEPEQRDLLVRLGESLGNAGRGAEAVAAYLAAAEVAATHDEPSGIRTSTSMPVLLSSAGFDMPLECRRRAAEQMFRSGSFDQGWNLLHALMRSAGLRVSHSSVGALVALLWRRVWLRLRGLGYRARPVEDIPPRERQRIDLLWTGALTTSAVDLVRGAEMTTRCLLMSLRQGDEARIAASLALDAGHVSSRGGKYARRAATLARRASAIARRNGDPLARGLSAFAPGVNAMLTGRWRLARVKLARAEEIFREECIGANWEVATAQAFLCLALYYLGEWHVLGQQTVTSIRHALERGDRYTAAVLDCLAPYGDLWADDLPGARDAIAQAAVHWQATSGYHLQHYLQLLARIQIDLYAGEAEAAWACISAEWGPLRRSLLRRVQMTRVESAHMYARCALAMAVAEPTQAACFTRIAARNARALMRERMLWSVALAKLLHAGVAACRGHVTRALALLEEAEDLLEHAEMHLFAAAAARQRGRLLGGAAGQELVAEADGAMIARGIANPAAVAGMLAPGFPEPAQ